MDSDTVFCITVPTTVDADSVVGMVITFRVDAESNAGMVVVPILAVGTSFVENILPVDEYFKDDEVTVIGNIVFITVDAGSFSKVVNFTGVAVSLVVIIASIILDTISVVGVEVESLNVDVINVVGNLVTMRVESKYVVETLTSVDI